MTDKINLLMKIPGYGNFNKVINEALFYGLPILAEKICGDAVTQEERAALTMPRKAEAGRKSSMPLSYSCCAKRC